MTKTSILDMPLDFQLVGKKYYLTLAGKRLKTKQGHEVFADSIMQVNAIQEDYKQYKFKSKWINLISSYVDFVNTQENIDSSKKQIVSYLKNDLLFYIDKPSSEFHEYQNKTYNKLIDEFKQMLNISQILEPTTGFGEINFAEESLKQVNDYLERMSNQELFISLFLSRISTSSILTLKYLANKISIDDFYDIAFAAEIAKLKKADDNEEYQRLKIIKQELEILNYFYKDGLE